MVREKIRRLRAEAHFFVGRKLEEELLREAGE